MGKKSRQYENMQIVVCESCGGVISFEFYLRSGDVVCCKECDAEYLINSRKPLLLQLLEDDYEEDDSDCNFMQGNDDDDYSDGRYD